MFDYLVNKYNRSPILITKNDLDQEYLYVVYTKAPYLVLPRTLEDLKIQHKRKFWYNLKRSERLFEERYGKLYFDVIREKEKIEYFSDQVFDLFNNRWLLEYTSSAWKSKDGFGLYKDALIDLASKGGGFLAVLHDENQNLLSYAYCLVQDNSLYFYQHTTTVNHRYRTFSLGKILIFKLLKYGISKGYYKFDFMSGTMPYKTEWTKEFQFVYEKIGKKNVLNYFKFFCKKIKYFLQYNHYTRKVLKFVFYNLEKLIGKF